MIRFTPEQIAALPAAEQAWVLQALEQQAYLESPAAFGCLDKTFVRYRHVDYTSGQIVGMVERDDCDVLLVQEPVRHGKTELCSRKAVAWYLCKYPSRKVGLASYEAEFAATHGRAARTLIEDYGEKFGVRVDPRSSAANRWDIQTMDETGNWVTAGGMWTAGVGGPITGRGGHLMIVDDPVKNTPEMNNEDAMKKVWEWWQSTFLTRREPGGKVLVIMSRWREDDLIGMLLANQQGLRVKVIRLPALAEEDDPLGRRPGEALCPERYDEQALGAIREASAAAWPALYQQRPVPAEGGSFKRSSFRYWRQHDDGYLLLNPNGTSKLVERADLWCFYTFDPAFTRQRKSDYTAIAKWGVATNDQGLPCLLLLDAKKEKVDSVFHADMLLAAWGTVPKPKWIGVERQNATLSLMTEIQRKGVIIRELRPDKSKVARAETAAALLDAGRIYWPKNATWLDEWENEILMFPNGAHDDYVDTLSYAANEIARGVLQPKRKRSPEPSTPDERMAAYLRNRSGSARTHEVLGRF